MLYFTRCLRVGGISMILAAYVDGYPYLYDSEEEEISVYLQKNERSGGLRTGSMFDPKLIWLPSTRDFKEQARRVGSGIAASVSWFEDFVDQIRKYERLTEVHLYGHGTMDTLLFARDDTGFRMDIRAIKNGNVSKNLVPGGCIRLFTCGSGTGDTSLQRLANCLGVEVKGYKGSVEWKIGYTPDEKKVIWRKMTSVPAEVSKKPALGPCNCDEIDLHKTPD
jgi:hypothetical protein